MEDEVGRSCGLNGVEEKHVYMYILLLLLVVVVVAVVVVVVEKPEGKRPAGRPKCGWVG
jgi:hypothetical protein